MIIANNQEIQNNCFQEKKSFSENFLHEINTKIPY